MERRRARTEAPLESFLTTAAAPLESGALRRVPGHAMFLAPSRTLAPAALRAILRADRGLQTWPDRAVVLLTRFADQPVWQFDLPVDHTLEVGTRVRL